MAALLLVMGAALPAWADDASDCKHGVALVKTDLARVLPAGRKLPNQGDAAAQYDLGCMYDKGVVVPQSYAEAAKWYRKAADPTAQG